MRGWGRVTCLVVAMLSVWHQTKANSYDDFTKGLSAFNAGRYELAVEAFSAALAQGDLAAPYVPVAYIRRANAYLALGNCSSALTDFNTAAKDKSPDIIFLLKRIGIELCVGDKAAAEKDFLSARALKPNPDEELYAAYAVALWNNADWGAAADMFRQAIAHTHEASRYIRYNALLYTTSALRAGKYDPAILDGVTEKQPSDWPMPILAFYRGKGTAEQVYHAAESYNAVRAKEQKCEADFYLGEWHLAHGDIATGTPLIYLAAENCPHNFTEYSLALTEKGRLAQPSQNEPKVHTSKK